jgi:hypothetical protein
MSRPTKINSDDYLDILTKHTKGRIIIQRYVECGIMHGAQLVEAMAAFGEVIGVELSEHYVDYCRKKFRKHSYVAIVHSDSVQYLTAYGL